MRNEVGRGRRRRDGELNNLLQLKEMRRRYASPGCADIERLGQLNKPHSKCVHAPQEDGDLDADAGGLPLLRTRHRILSLQELTGQRNSL